MALALPYRMACKRGSVRQSDGANGKDPTTRGSRNREAVVQGLGNIHGPYGCGPDRQWFVSLAKHMRWRKENAEGGRHAFV